MEKASYDPIYMWPMPNYCTTAHRNYIYFIRPHTDGPSELVTALITEAFPPQVKGTIICGNITQIVHDSTCDMLYLSPSPYEFDPRIITVDVSHPELPTYRSTFNLDREQYKVHITRGMRSFNNILFISTSMEQMYNPQTQQMPKVFYGYCYTINYSDPDKPTAHKIKLSQGCSSFAFAQPGLLYLNMFDYKDIHKALYTINTTYAYNANTFSALHKYAFGGLLYFDEANNRLIVFQYTLQTQTTILYMYDANSYTNLVLVGQFSIHGFVDSYVAVNNCIYILVLFPESPSSHKLEVIDVSKPQSIHSIASLQLPGRSNLATNGKYLYASGENLYVFNCL